jgi:hypothetical protein
MATFADPANPLKRKIHNTPAIAIETLIPSCCR